MNIYTFEYLYFGNDGYVARCKLCRHLQLGFICMCLTFNEEDYRAFRMIVHHHYNKADYSFEDYRKYIVVKTPAEGIYFMLTKYEAKRLYEILEEAENESLALSLISLFNQ
ncbi:MAG TPA: DUF6686 family protein [Chitinophagaceae bacterium]|nr:DUF6686 family protein [Chitinophagaceae bacterium]